MISYAIRTQNASQNKHLAAIETILEKHNVKATFGYVMTRDDKMVGAKWDAKDVSSAVHDEVMALPIPASAWL